MTHDREPVPELTTAPIGGGRRVWLIALGALVVLGGFVYLGLTGPAAPTGTPPPKPSTAVAVASPTLAPSPNLNEVTSIRADPTAPLLYQYLGTSLTLNGHGTLAILDQVSPNQYRGIYRIPYALAAPTGQLEFDAVTASVSHDDLDRIGSWTVPMSSIGRGAGPPIIVLESGAGPSGQALSNPDFSKVTTNGYQLTVTVQGLVDAQQMTIDLAVSPDDVEVNESFALKLGDPDKGLTVDLERFDRGSYDGDLQIPKRLLGATLPLTLLATPLSDPQLGPITVASQSITLASTADAFGADQVEIHHDPQPVGYGASEIVGTGYDLYVGQSGIRGDLHLVVILAVRQPSAPFTQ